MKILLAGLLAGGLGLALGATESQPEPLRYAWAESTDATAIVVGDAGARLIERFGGSFMVEVERMLATIGAEAAVSELHLKNFPLPTPRAGTPRATAIKLTSLRVRNPLNAPDAADLAALERTKDLLQSGLRPPRVLVQTVDRPGAPTEWRVYRPIAVAPSCLQCHGPVDSLPPGVRTSLERLYPGDRATDYFAYDWRGLLRVSYEAPAK